MKITGARIIFSLSCLAFLVTCVANRVPETVESMELFLNQKIGTEFPKGDLNYFKRIYEVDEFIELERKRANGCSYVFLVNKKSFIIQKWWFTSDRSLCTYSNQPRV